MKNLMKITGLCCRYLRSPCLWLKVQEMMKHVFHFYACIPEVWSTFIQEACCPGWPRYLDYLVFCFAFFTSIKLKWRLVINWYIWSHWTTWFRKSGGLVPISRPYRTSSNLILLCQLSCERNGTYVKFINIIPHAKL